MKLCELQNTALSDIIRDHPTHEVTYDTHISKVLERMNQLNIISMPVYGPAGHWTGAGLVDAHTKSKQYVGIVSVLDIARYLIQQCDENQWESKMNEALAHPVYRVVGETNESLSLWVYDETATLRSGMEPLEKGVHRMLVATTSPQSQDKDEKEFKLLTQFDVIHFFSQKIDHLESDIWSKTVGELGKVTDEEGGQNGAPNKSLIRCVDQISYSTSLRDAILLLCQHSRYALPFVDEEGKLLGTFSLSDLRLLNASLLAIMPNLSVVDFLDKVKQPFPKAAIKCTPSTTVGEVLTMFSQLRCHRFWIVDEQDHIVGVVSLTDMIRLLYQLWEE